MVFRVQKIRIHQTTEQHARSQCGGKIRRFFSTDFRNCQPILPQSFRKCLKRFCDICLRIRPCSGTEILQRVGKASKLFVVVPSRGNTSVMPLNCKCDDPTRLLPRSNGTMGPMIDSANGRILKALLEASPVLSEVMQQTGKACFICQTAGNSELFGPFCDVEQVGGK